MEVTGSPPPMLPTSCPGYQGDPRLARGPGPHICSFSDFQQGFLLAIPTSRNNLMRRGSKVGTDTYCTSTKAGIALVLYVILAATLSGRYYYQPHPTDEETEA